MLEPIHIRHLEQTDIEAVVRCERESHKVVFKIPELPQLGDIEVCHPWAWKEEDIVSVSRRYRSKDKGQYDTRILVAEVPVTVMDADNLPFEVYAVVGCVAYEIQADGYEILLLSAMPWLTIPGHPDGGTFVRSQLLEKMLTKAENAEKRNKVSIYIPDGDWTNLKFFRKLGWPAKLHPYFYADGNDAWYCEYQTTVKEPEEANPVS